MRKKNEKFCNFAYFSYFRATKSLENGHICHRKRRFDTSISGRILLSAGRGGQYRTRRLLREARRMRRPLPVLRQQDDMERDERTPNASRRHSHPCSRVRMPQRGNHRRRASDAQSRRTVRGAEAAWAINMARDFGGARSFRQF